jgi:hypothetical protein
MLFRHESPLANANRTFRFSLVTICEELASDAIAGYRPGSAVDWPPMAEVDPFLPVGFLQSGLTRGDGSSVFRFHEAAVRDLPQPA